MNGEIVVKKPAQKAPHGIAVLHTPPNKQRYGAWGRVDKVYSNNHTADVYLDTGMFLKQVPVSSKEWVVPGDDYTTGQRDLPPVNARVFVFMPYGDYDGCFILCSGFVVTDKAQKGAFMEDEKERIRKRVYPGNWKWEYHYATGTYELTSPDEKTRLKIDYGTEQEAKEPHELRLTLFEKIKFAAASLKSLALSVFDDEVKVEHIFGEKIRINAFDTEIEIKEDDMTVKCGGNLKIDAAGTIDIIAGGEITVNGSVIRLN
jgi:hypothetical protein